MAAEASAAMGCLWDQAKNSPWERSGGAHGRWIIDSRRQTRVENGGVFAARAELKA